MARSQLARAAARHEAAQRLVRGRSRRTAPWRCVPTGSPSRPRRASAGRRPLRAQPCPPRRSDAKRRNARAIFYHVPRRQRRGIRQSRWYSPARGKRLMAWYKREDNDDVFSEEKRSVPVGVFTKCPGCRAALLTADLEKNDQRLPAVRAPFPDGGAAAPGARARPRAASPRPTRRSRASTRWAFKDSKRYADRLRAARRNAGSADAVLVGVGQDRRACRSSSASSSSSSWAARWARSSARRSRACSSARSSGRSRPSSSRRRAGRACRRACCR